MIARPILSLSEAGLRIPPALAGSTAALSPAYRAADPALAAKGRSFDFTRQLLGGVHTDRATLLYGFCRRVDDLADEAAVPEAARAALGALACTQETGAPDDRALRHLVQRMRQWA